MLCHFFPCRAVQCDDPSWKNTSPIYSSPIGSSTGTNVKLELLGSASEALDVSILSSSFDFPFVYQLSGSHLLTLLSLLVPSANVDLQVLLLQWLVKAQAILSPFGVFFASFWPTLYHNCIKAYLFFSNHFGLRMMHFMYFFLRCLVLLEAEVSLFFPPFPSILKDRRIQWLHSISSSFPNPVLVRRFRCFSIGLPL